MQASLMFFSGGDRQVTKGGGGQGLALTFVTISLKCLIYRHITGVCYLCKTIVCRSYSTYIFFNII